MTKPIKTYKAGNISGAIWFNEKEINNEVVGYKTVSLRRSWKDKDKDVWREDVINLRKQDVAKLLVVLNKIQEDLILNTEEPKGEEKDE